MASQIYGFVGQIHADIITGQWCDRTVLNVGILRDVSNSNGTDVAESRGEVARLFAR
jgi:hypothetical protein